METLTTADLMYLLEVDRSTIIRRGQREGWEFRPRVGRGGGKNWIIASMPKATRREIGEALISKPFPREALAVPDAIEVTAPPCSEASLPDAFSEPLPPAFANTGNLTEKQRAVMIARKGILMEVARLTAVMSKREAIMSLEKGWRDGTIEEGLRQKAIAANDKVGKSANRGMSYSTIYNWLRQYEQGGEAALAPKHPGPDMRVPEWAAAFLFIYQTPQKPSIADAYRQFIKVWPGTPPLEGAVRRFVNKIAMPDRERGRRTDNALLRILPHKRRDASGFWPGDIYTADGTTLDAEVQNPLTGKPFKPEVTMVLDVVTRRCVGISVGLAESALAVLDALRVACLFGGVPAKLYTDNGPGYRNQLMGEHGTCMMDRLGITMTNSIPGRPRGKGLMERGVQTICVPLAKRLTTCTHADMDRDAAKKIFKITRAHIKQHGSSALMLTWAEFRVRIVARVDEYNNTPHRGLKKIVDPKTGRLRHPSPNEAWEAFRANGWEPFLVQEHLRDELFMPSEMRMVRNGEVQVLGSRYYSNELADFHGERVEIRYDVWDASKIFVWSTSGQRICTAELDANVIPYFPKNRIEDAREKRAKAKISRLENKIQAIAPGTTVLLPESPHTYTLMADSLTQPAQEPVVLETLFEQPQEHSTKRPVFTSEFDRYVWLIQNTDKWTDHDAPWLEKYVASEGYKDLEDYYRPRGLAWGDTTSIAGDS